MHSSTVLQGQIQAHPEIPPPPMSAGGTGAEAHLPTSRGKHHQPCVVFFFVLLFVLFKKLPDSRVSTIGV